MYTELKELVNFLAKFTRNRIPRRRMSIFLEHLANGLLVKHEAAWKVDNPISGATERAIRINTASGTTELLTSVASTLGIDIHALLSSFPMEMVAFWNPGEVFYRLGDTPTNLPIWSGDVNADTNYSCAPASECNYVRLELAPWDQHSDFYWSTDVFSPSNVPRLVFRFVPPHDQAFTASSFAVTRFGSRRPQPDHEALKRIQHAAEHLTVGGGGGAPIVAGTTNMPPNKQINSGTYVYPSNTTMVTLMGQPARSVVFPTNSRPPNAYLVNANGGAYTIVKQNHHHHQQQQQQQQSRAAGIMNGIAQQHVHPTNQYYAMGDAAMLKYLASAKKNAQGPRTSLGDVASKTLQLLGPCFSLTRVEHERGQFLCFKGRGDGQNIEHASVQEVAFNQHNPHPIFSTGTGGDRLMRGATIATTSQEGASGSMRSNNGESIFDTEQPNAQNYVRNEETGMPDNVGLNDGEQNVTGNAKKWKDLA
ncbi:unnamed protein product [Toxocara canis]|uniref:Anti_prolifrtn domain-containing protein n=1 Tax=Toxocara canis TaxID=6265 RepID=A0A183UJA3_TOXCA|nr:unnamed protein product [Toxocara canis]